MTIKTLEVMVDGYEKLEFPQIRSDFSDTKIYWRRSREAPPGIEESGVLVEADSEVAQEGNTEEVVQRAKGAEAPESRLIEEEMITKAERAPEKSKQQEPRSVEEPRAEPVEVVQARTESIREAIETGIAEETTSTKEPKIKKVEHPLEEGGVKL